jgi:hypothetical protein
MENHNAFPLKGEGWDGGNALPSRTLEARVTS